MIFTKIKSKLDKWIIEQQGGEKCSTYLRKMVYQKSKVDVGLYTYGSCFHKDFNIGGSVDIGRYCSFAPDIHYFGANHPMEYATMSPYFYQQSWAVGGVLVKDVERFKLKIGNDCWIGYGTIITCNCREIGNGAVIGAGSVVTKDVEPYSIVAGNPARIIRYRFEKDIIDILEESRWYELEPDILLKFYNDVGSPEIFAKKILEYRRNR